jgi:thiol:disulfide interchange protein DsbG
MKFLLLATSLVTLPALGFAQSRCAVPSEATIQIPPPVKVGGPPVSLAPNPANSPLPSAVHNPSLPIPIAATVPAPADVTQDGTDALASPAIASGEVAAIPMLQHIAAAGAALFDLGMSHGLRAVFARNGAQLMVFEVTPDGQAMVAGLITELSVNQLRKLGGADVTELQVRHGLRTLVLRTGTQFQVFYATPDGERAIPGVMWDATGRDITREQIASIPGAVPTVTIGDGVGHDNETATPGTSPSMIALAKRTIYGTVGNAAAPELWMFIDPQCSFSIRAMQGLAPYIATGRVRLHVIPLSILDSEDNGLSTRRALSLVSTPADQMVTAWENGHLPANALSDAVARLQANMAAAAAVQVRGTPTFLWQKTDGTEGRMDGLPNDMAALITSVGGGE